MVLVPLRGRSCRMVGGGLTVVGLVMSVYFGVIKPPTTVERCLVGNVAPCTGQVFTKCCTKDKDCVDPDSVCVPWPSDSCPDFLSPTSRVRDHQRIDVLQGQLPRHRLRPGVFTRGRRHKTGRPDGEQRHEHRDRVDHHPGVRPLVSMHRHLLQGGWEQQPEHWHAAGALYDSARWRRPPAAICSTAACCVRPGGPSVWSTSKMRIRRTLPPPSPGPLGQCGTQEPGWASG